MNNWGLYVLFLIVAAGIWEIYKSLRARRKGKKATNSQYSPGHYNSYVEPLFRLTPKFTLERWVCFVGSLSTLYIAFGILLPVLLTGDFNAMSVSDNRKNIVIFLFFLVAFTYGSVKTGPFLMVKFWVKMTRNLGGTYLFFDRHLEFRPFLSLQKQIYPYRIMEVRLGKFGRNNFDSIGIRKILPGRGASEDAKEPSWHEDIITIGRPHVTEDEFIHLEDFLAARAERFHRDELSSDAEQGLDKNANNRLLTFRWYWYLLFPLFVMLVIVILLVWLDFRLDPSRWTTG